MPECRLRGVYEKRQNFETKAVDTLSDMTGHLYCKVLLMHMACIRNLQNVVNSHSFTCKEFFVYLLMWSVAVRPQVSSMLAASA